MASGSYDFVIVGGGTAGLVLARRLSEDESQSILVLEAGLNQSHNLQVGIPASYGKLLGGDLDWKFMSKPQPQLLNRTVSLSQGKALGGSTMINAQIWAPLSKPIIDSWAALGNEGWDWDSVSGVYDMTHTYPSVPPTLRGTLGIDTLDGKGDTCSKGPIQTSFPMESHPLREAWAKTFKSLGYLMSTDPTTGLETLGGFSNLASVNPLSSARSDAANCYYEPSKDRQNMHVVTNATVEKVLFESRPILRAVGVQFSQGAKVHTVSARKEVIISAGALQSPKILELSGIGDGRVLAKHNITVIKELASVGEGLQDHLVVDLGFEAVEDLETRDPIIRQEPAALQQAMAAYTHNQSGILTCSGVITYAYMPTVNLLSPDRLAALLEKHRPERGEAKEERRKSTLYSRAENALLDPFAPSAVYFTSLGQNPFASDVTTGARVFSPLPNKHMVIAGVLSHPLSRGSVHIQSGNALDAPEIDPRYLENPADAKIFAEHMLNVQSLASTPPLSALLKQPPKASRPISSLANLEEAEKYVRLRAVSMWHPAGTCSMLPEEDGGVVDNHLRVYGVKGLRVVDSSVIPILPPGNLQSSVYAVAEKAASLIKGEYGLK